MAFIKRDLFGNFDVPTEIFRRRSRPKYILCYATPPDWGIPVLNAPPLCEGLTYAPNKVRIFAHEFANRFDARTAELPAHTGLVAVYANIKDKVELLASYQYGDTVPADVAHKTLNDHCARFELPVPHHKSAQGFYVYTPHAGIAPMFTKTAAVIHPVHRRVLWAAEMEKQAGLKLKYT